MSTETLAEATVATARALQEAGVPGAATDARWLVAAASGTDPRRAPEQELPVSAARQLAVLVARRCAREPLQLIVGSTAFRTIELRCRAGVFIPRPETEILAQLAIDLVRAARPAGAHVVVHEPCCGTGAVGLAVASEVAGAVVLLGDRSEAAVRLAQENRDLLIEQGRLQSSVEVLRGPLLAAFDGSAHGSPDVIVANPPYLPDADLATLDPEVAGHDPHDALAGGPDGHEVVDRLLAAASEALRPGGAVALEVDARRAAEAAEVAERVGLVDVAIRQDLTGADRFVLGRSRGPSGVRG